MKPGPKKLAKLSLAVAAWLASLMLSAGCGPYPLQPYQAQPYPPPGWGPPAAAPLPPGAQGPALLRNVAHRVFGLTNDIRRQYSLPPLDWEGALSGVCQAYGADMLQRRFFSHTNPEGLTAGERLKPFYSGPVYGWGENIWEGSNLSAPDNEALARTMMNSWISSPGHRQNLLNPDYTHLGVGVAASGREIRAAQLFATLPRDRGAF
jgi:uncharacterized protein YkwD